MKQQINYYQILKLTPKATEKEIKKAYITLVQKYHPDKNQGNKIAEKRFKQINQAYQILKDPVKRQALDVFLVQKKTEAALARSQAKSQATTVLKKSSKPKESFLSSINSLISQPKREEKALDLETKLPVSIETLCQKKAFKLVYTKSINGKKQKDELSAQLPENAYLGMRLLFKKKGSAVGRKVIGDLRLTITLKDHLLFKVRDQDLYLKLPVIFIDALLGKKIQIPTAYGKAFLQIPAKTKDKHILKLKNMGLPARAKKPKGNMFVKILIDYPAGKKIKIYNEMKSLPASQLNSYLYQFRSKKNQYLQVDNYHLACKQALAAEEKPYEKK